MHNKSAGSRKLLQPFQVDRKIARCGGSAIASEFLNALVKRMPECANFNIICSTIGVQKDMKNTLSASAAVLTITVFAPQSKTYR